MSMTDEDLKALAAAAERATAYLAKAREMGVERSIIGRGGPGLHMENLQTLIDAAADLAASRAEMARLRGREAELMASLEPFAKVAAPKYPGEKHSSELYGLENQTGTGELQLYSPFSDGNRELTMWTDDFHAALAALTHGQGAK